MGLIDDFLSAHDAAPDPDPDDVDAWARALSLTGALLSHLAASPQTQSFVFEMLASGVTPTAELVPGATPFHEVMSGLQSRELCGPDVFSRYFGAAPA